MKLNLLTFIIFALMFAACNSGAPHYVIGVSQCSDDIWREKQNSELRMGSYLRDDVELRFAAAYDSDERQVQQIDSLIATGIDLLIVAPNQIQTISPAIDRAYDSGIPVIVFERKTNSKKYTAFVSADNYEMGRGMGEYVASQLGGKGNIVEIMGLQGSSPAVERHNGFNDAISRYPEIHNIAILQGDWTEQSAYQAVNAYNGVLHDVDFVFAHNDRMAVGAIKAFKDNKIRFCGIDGLPGEGGGIQLVRDSVLVATYIYPTRGDCLLDLAVNILENRPFDKEILLPASIVTADNANVLSEQSEEIMRQSAYLDRLHQKADVYLQKIDTQRLMLWLLLIVFFTVIISALLVMMNMSRRHRLERQAFSMVTNVPQTVQSSIENNAEQPQPDTVAPQTPSSEPDTKTSEKAAVITDVPAEYKADVEAGADADARFLERLRQYVQEQMSDSDFNVETLASQMGVSRAQLYRKVKAMTGRTPVDIIRLSRLNRSKVLLAKEGTSVSEVAYAVGFSSPSYFTKCFKDEYGQLPGEFCGH